MTTCNRCELCHNSAATTFDPNTLCDYHRSQYEYVVSQEEEEPEVKEPVQ